MSKVFGAVNIQRNFYTMATVGNNKAEVTMYGDIVEQQPTNWWGEPIDGQYITLKEFLDDLEQIANCSEITIRMNSCGGDAGVSILIHNRLRDLVLKGTKLICIVDGCAMSGGSLIMCACDTVKVNPSSLIMIHKCWSFLFGGYNADELRNMADSNDAYDKAQVSIYKRKSGLSDTVLMHMMSDTTYMTGSEAVEKGFANELLENAEPIEIAASADGRSIIAKGRQMRLAPGMFVPDNIPTVKAAAKNPVDENILQKSAMPTAKEEGGIPMAKTVAELRNEYPELVAQIENEAKSTVVPDASATEAAVKAERDRIKAIDEIAPLYDDETVNAAKYGENVCSAQELALNEAKKSAAKGQQFMANARADAVASNASKVGAAPGAEVMPEDEKTEEQKLAEAKAFVTKALGKKED